MHFKSFQLSNAIKPLITQGVAECERIRKNKKIKIRGESKTRAGIKKTEDND